MRTNDELLTLYRDCMSNSKMEFRTVIFRPDGSQTIGAYDSEEEAISRATKWNAEFPNAFMEVQARIVSEWRRHKEIRDPKK